jgi:hypothetical protein
MLQAFNRNLAPINKASGFTLESCFKFQVQSFTT